MIKKLKTLYLAMILTLLVLTGNAYAVTYCDGIYSPGNPYECKFSGIEGNCVWWTWHWLRYGKGDRKLHDSNSFRGSPKTWASKATSLGYTVLTTPTVGTVAVNDIHVATVDQVTSTQVLVSEMNAGMSGFRQKWYNRTFFKFYIVPDPQPRLSRIDPQPIYRYGYDRSFTLTGENMDKVATLELTFPGGGKGSLSGTQIQWRNYTQLGFQATFGTKGNYIINAVSDRRVESIPQMPFTVYE